MCSLVMLMRFKMLQTYYVKDLIGLNQVTTCSRVTPPHPAVFIYLIATFNEFLDCSSDKSSNFFVLLETFETLTFRKYPCYFSHQASVLLWHFLIRL